MATQTAPKISKAKARLLMDHPFFATLLLRTQVVVTDAIPLAATDGDHIYYNPDFLEICTVEDVMCVLAHEVGHDSLLHSIRLGARNADVWNQACDHAINLMLIDQGFKCPKSVPGGWLADPKFKGMSADRIYDELRREQQSQPKSGQGKPGKGQPGQGDPSQGNQPGDQQGDDPSDGSGKPQPGKGGNRPSDQNASGGKPGPKQEGRDWLHGDVLPTKAADPAQQAAAEQRAKQRVAAAANMARMAGKLKGELARMVDDMLEAKVHWTEVLREHMTEVVRSRDNWARRNRRYSSIYLPSRRERKMGPIIFIPDTSGSMMGDDMEKICSEIAHCSMQTQPEHIRVVWADAAVQGEQVFDPNTFSYKALDPKGGGGTDMRVPLKHVEKYQPQVVVLMTDGYTPWPSNPCPFPVICICTTEKKCPEWMQVIRV